ncbi:hypothetical protein QZH41_018397, partial [Actinostola sp. cb2023]
HRLKMTQLSVFAMVFTFASLLKCQGAPTTPTVSPLPPASSNRRNSATLTKRFSPLNVRSTKTKLAKAKKNVLSTCNTTDPVHPPSFIGEGKLFSERIYFLQIIPTRNLTKPYQHLKLNGRVSGTPDNYNPWVTLDFESVGAGLIRIKGKKADLYLSMDKEGSTYAKKIPDSESVFKKIQAKHGFTAYRSNKYCSKFIRMKKNGHLKKGGNVNEHHHSTHFLEVRLSSSR